MLGPPIAYRVSVMIVSSALRTFTTAPMFTVYIDLHNVHLCAT